EVEEARAPHDAAADDFDLLDARRVREEDALDADVEAHLAYSERAARTRAVALGDDALEDLGALLVALDDAVVDTHGIAHAEIGQVRPEELGLELGELGRREHGENLRINRV